MKKLLLSALIVILCITAVLCLSACRGNDTTTTISACSHIEETIPGKDATCTETGLTEGKKCSVCQTVTVEQSVIPVKPHTEVEIAAVDSTCAKTGLTEGKKCSVCQTVIVEQSVIPVKPHTEVEIMAVEATCTETGLTKGKKCSVCQTVTVEQSVIPVKPHTEVEITAVEATCTETGLTEGKKCSVCQTVTVEQIIIPTIPHIEIILDAVEATCTETGLTEGKKCSVCQTVTIKQAVIPASHKEITLPCFAPTCLYEGLTTGKKCMVCHTVTQKQTIIPKLDHTLTTLSAIPSTCTKEGLTEGKKCSICNTIIIEQKVLPKHTCINGICTVCNAKEFSVGLEFELNEDKSAYTLIGQGSFDGYDLVIPDVYNNLPVTAIGDRAFTNCKNIISVTIPETITEISGSPFYGCSKIMEVYNLSSLDVSSNFVYAKAINNSLDEESIIKNVDGFIFMDFGNEFYLMGSTKKDVDISLPTNYNGNPYSVYEYAFKDNYDIIKLTIPANVISIDSTSFESCYKLIEIYNLSSLDVDEIFEYSCVIHTSIDEDSIITRSGDFLFANIYSGNYLVAYDGDNTEVYLPAKYLRDNYSVYKYAFYHNKVITKLFISDGVKSIGDYAFYYCENIKSIRFGDTIESIGQFAFAYCSSNTQITLGESVKTIGDYAFLYNAKAYSLYLPDTITNVGNNAFDLCINLNNVTVGKGVKTFGSSAFLGCEAIEKVYISDLLNWCKIDFDHGVSNPLYYNAALYLNNEIVTVLTMPKELSEMKPYTFVGCSSIIKLIVPSSSNINSSTDIREISAGAFSNCINLEEITLGSNVQIIHGGAFDNCKSLKKINWPHVGLYDFAIGSYAFYNCDSLITLAIPGNCLTIGEYAFAECDNLEYVYGVDRARTVGSYAFYNSRQIRYVTYDTLEDWCRTEFKNETSNPLFYSEALYEIENLEEPLTDLAIPSNITSIQPYSFYNCSSLLSVNFHPSITSVGKNAFEGCYNLNKVTTPHLSHWLDIEFSNFYSNPLVYAGNLYIGNSLLTELVVPYYKTELKNYAFAGCTSITSIDIHEDVTSIGSAVFADCKSITSFTVPKQITSIPSSMFEGCCSLREVIFHDNVNIIGNEAFKDCLNLYEVKLTNIKAIKARAFAHCRGLVSITIAGRAPTIDDEAFSLCDNVREIYDYLALDMLTFFDNPDKITLHDCQMGGEYEESIIEIVDDYIFATDENKYYLVGYIGDDTELTLPEDYRGNKYIISSCAFFYKQNISKVTIPDNVTSIEDEAFAFCYSLKEVYIGNGVTSIGKNAFSFCNILILSIGDSVTEIKEDAFYANRILKLTIGKNISDVGLLELSSELTLEIYNLSSLDVKSLFKNAKAIHTSLNSESILEFVNDYIFMFYENEYTLVGYIGNEVELILPESCNNKTYSINDYAFASASILNPNKFIKVTIPNGVTHIGKIAFGSCAYLKEIVLPESITYIGDAAFSGCSALKIISIPDGIRYIGENAFSGCTLLLEKENGVYYVNNWMVDLDSDNHIIPSLRNGTVGITTISVYNTDSIVKFVIPEGVKYILDYAFASYTNLRTITLPSSIEYLGNNALSSGLVEIYNLSDIDLSKKVKDSVVIYDSLSKPSIIEFVDDYIFMTRDENYYLIGYIGEETVITLPDNYREKDYLIYGGTFFKPHITEVTIPSGVSYIGNGAFSNCHSLVKVNLTNGLTYIGDYAFFNCKKLCDINIPLSVTYVGNYAFEDCPSLPLEKENGIVYLGTWALKCEDDINNAIIRNDTIGIAANCFANKNITDVAIPDSVMYINDYAFYYCENLTSITMGKGVTCIGECAFCHCKNLTNADIGKNVSFIGISAFSRCSKLTNVTIPNSVKCIGSEAFRYCPNITRVDIESVESWCNIRFDDNYANPLRVAEKLYLNGVLVTDLVIPNSVIEINNYAFYGCKSLKSITIPNNVTSIGIFAFYACDGITNVTFENTVVWYIVEDLTATDGTIVDVTDQSINANNLKYDYAYYYWKRNA